MSASRSSTARPASGAPSSTPPRPWCTCRSSAKEQSPPADQFTIALEPRDGGGLLRLSWAEASYVVPLGPPAADPVVIGRTTYQIIPVPPGTQQN